MNTQKPLKTKVSITLDEDVIRHIRDLAESDDRNFSQYINLVLKKHIHFFRVFTARFYFYAKMAMLLNRRKTGRDRLYCAGNLSSENTVDFCNQIGCKSTFLLCCMALCLSAQYFFVA